MKPTHRSFTAGSWKDEDRTFTLKLEAELRQAEKGLELSICGTLWDSRVRNDCISAGQNRDDLRQLLAEPTADLKLPRATLERLAQIWDAWHLNGMNAGCSHQRALGWGSKRLKLSVWRLADASIMARRSVLKAAEETLLAGKTAKLDAGELALAKLPWKVKLPTEAGNPDPTRYALDHEEEPWAGHVKPDEHPEGVLCKPCPTCGYGYGTAWLYEPLPDDVVAFIHALPGDQNPPS